MGKREMSRIKKSVAAVLRMDLDNEECPARVCGAYMQFGDHGAYVEYERYEAVSNAFSLVLDMLPKDTDLVQLKAQLTLLGFDL